MMTDDRLLRSKEHMMAENPPPRGGRETEQIVVRPGDTTWQTTDTGRRPYSAADDDIDIPRALNLRRDRVRWGPILAGFLTALTALLLLNLLGVAIGLTTMNAGTAAAEGGPPPDAGRNSAIWAAIAGILSFLLGGYVAGRTAAVFDRGWGALNGALVFLLGVPITLWLAGQGLGAVLGSLGALTSGLNVDSTQAQNVANQAQQAANNVQPIDVARAAERARNAAWGALLGSL
ncbi:MAG: hypothetical protein JO352_29885, partial [Chloroflexi bacterium]|nr:hypothetical protein [Chloroflexota bacterium]